MDNPRYLDCLAADFARLRAAVHRAPAALVPTCPGWTATDLTRHVARVYLHKALCIRDAAEPDPWPPAGVDDADPLELLDRAHADLLEQFAAHTADDPAASWYAPDQTVGFWIRRMAQETVIHRIDAELAAAQDPDPVPDDLARDGIDELLDVFVSYSVATWPDYFTEALADSPGRTFRITTPGASWQVATAPGSFTVTGGIAADLDDKPQPDVHISGTPDALLRFLWNRESPTGSPLVTVEGPEPAQAELRRCIHIATQ